MKINFFNKRTLKTPVMEPTPLELIESGEDFNYNFKNTRHYKRITRDLENHYKFNTKFSDENKKVGELDYQNAYDNLLLLDNETSISKLNKIYSVHSDWAKTEAKSQFKGVLNLTSEVIMKKYSNATELLDAFESQRDSIVDYYKIFENYSPEPNDARWGKINYTIIVKQLSQDYYDFYHTVRYVNNDSKKEHLPTLLEYYYENFFNDKFFGESTMDEISIRVKSYTFNKYKEFLAGDQSMPLEWVLELENN